MLKWILKAAMAVSSNPAVKAWVAKKALEAINRTRTKAENQMTELRKTAGLPAAVTKPPRIVRTKKDIMRPGQVAVVDGVAIRIVRLLRSNSHETVYEGVEA